MKYSKKSVKNIWLQMYLKIYNKKNIYMQFYRYEKYYQKKFSKINEIFQKM